MNSAEKRQGELPLGNTKVIEETQRTNKIVGGILEVQSRIQALEKCTWMNDEKKSNILIMPEGIIFKKQGIFLFLNDEPQKVNFYERGYLAPTNDDWQEIREAIGGGIDESVEFFREVLGMKKEVYWSSSELGEWYTPTNYMSRPHKKSGERVIFTHGKDETGRQGFLLKVDKREGSRIIPYPYLDSRLPLRRGGKVTSDISQSF